MSIDIPKASRTALWLAAHPGTALNADGIFTTTNRSRT